MAEAEADSSPFPLVLFTWLVVGVAVGQLLSLTQDDASSGTLGAAHIFYQTRCTTFDCQLLEEIGHLGASLPSGPTMFARVYWTGLSIKTRTYTLCIILPNLLEISRLKAHFICLVRLLSL